MDKGTEFETWKNAAQGTVWYWKTDRRGELVDEMAPGGRVFKISESDRMYNQDLAANDEQDIFKNGMCVPVRLLDGTEDAKEIASNPNLMSESDMAALFTGRIDTFKKRVGEISNMVVLNRMLELAVEKDAKQSQIQALKERVVEIGPKVVSRETVGDVPTEDRSGTQL